MRNGSVVQDGSPEDIYSHPVNSFVADFIGHSNLFDAVVESVHPVRLSLLGGSYTCRECSDIVAGQKVKALIRPEVIQIQGDPPLEAANIASGLVRDATFKGPYVDYLVDVEHQRFKVHQSLFEGVNIFNRGERVFLTWSLEDALILPA
jgi:ABC-type Fe3+/spermidine/putrescine transport system ATPase subunit